MYKEYRQTEVGSEPSGLGNDATFFDNLVWLSSTDAAIYLRKLDRNGKPSLGAIHTMVCRGRLRPRKFGNRLYFRKEELDRLIDDSPPKTRRVA